MEKQEQDHQRNFNVTQTFLILCVPKVGCVYVTSACTLPHRETWGKFRTAIPLKPGECFSRRRTARRGLIAVVPFGLRWRHFFPRNVPFYDRTRHCSRSASMLRRSWSKFANRRIPSNFLPEEDTEL